MTPGLPAGPVLPQLGPIGGLAIRRRRYNRGVDMSIRVTYKDGVFEPLERVEGARPGTVYTVFSEEELRDIREAVGWLKVAELSFEFWNNPADAVYDTL